MQENQMALVIEASSIIPRQKVEFAKVKLGASVFFYALSQNKYGVTLALDMFEKSTSITLVKNLYMGYGGKHDLHVL